MSSELTTPYRMRRRGWGVDGNDKPITTISEKLPQREIGMSLDANNLPRNIVDTVIPDSRLSTEDIEALGVIVGADAVATDRDTRVNHAIGRFYPDLVRLHVAKLDVAPDAVALSKTEKHIEDLFKICAERKIAVTPFGGGILVVGGVEAVDGGMGKAIAVPIAAFNKIIDIDKVAGTVTVGTGVFGPDLEKGLSKVGFTAGHFPQSFEYFTVDGWISCRSADQESSGYGCIDRNVIGICVVAPADIMEFRDMPSSASGPNPCEFFLGSEGTLGIIMHVTTVLNQRPQKEMLFDTYFSNSFEEAAEELRKLEQSGNILHLARISDEKETLFGLIQLGFASMSEKVTKYLKLRGIDTPCMMIFGFAQTNPAGARVIRKRLAAYLLAKKCVRMSSILGMAWVNHRFSSPYLCDATTTRRIDVDTLETVTTWDSAVTLRREIAFAMEVVGEKHGTLAHVFCHISHIYESGYLLYFTYLLRETEGEILQQWTDIKTAVSRAMMNSGGTTTHHHGIGQDHSPQYYEENTELFAEVTRAIKDELDPAGILSPGKLATGPRSLEECYDGNMI